MPTQTKKPIAISTVESTTAEFVSKAMAASTTPGGELAALAALADAYADETGNRRARYAARVLRGEVSLPVRAMSEQSGEALLDLGIALDAVIDELIPDKIERDDRDRLRRSLARRGGGRGRHARAKDSELRCASAFRTTS